MRINDNSRPKEITSNEIWEVYKLLESLDEHYVFYDRCDAPEKREELFYLERTDIGDQGMIYEEPDNMGLRLPCSKIEWVKLSLTNVANGRKQRAIVKIEVNTLLKTKFTVEELLNKNHIRIPETSELADYKYEMITYGPGTDEVPEKLPVTHFSVKINNIYEKNKPDADTLRYWLESYMKSVSVPYKAETENGISKLKYVFMCDNAPGGFVEGCVNFFDKGAEAVVSYNKMGSEICRNSINRNELLILLNHLNTEGFAKSDFADNKWYDPGTLYTPRICLTEGDGFNISVKVMLNYRFWKSADTETDDYITSYLPGILDKLAHAIFGSLNHI